MFSVDESVAAKVAELICERVVLQETAEGKRSLFEDCLSLFLLANLAKESSVALSRERLTKRAEALVTAHQDAAKEPQVNLSEVAIFLWTLIRVRQVLRLDDLTEEKLKEMAKQFHGRMMAELPVIVETCKEGDERQVVARTCVAPQVGQVVFGWLGMQEEADSVAELIYSIMFLYGPQEYPQEPWFDYRQTFLAAWASAMGANPCDNRRHRWVSDLRRASMNTIWPVLRRAWLSADKATRNGLELFIPLALQVAPESPRDYLHIGRKALKAWKEEAEEGSLNREQQLVYALVRLPGLLDPSVSHRSSIKGRGVNRVLLTLLLGTRSPDSSLVLLRPVCKALLPIIWNFYLESVKGAVSLRNSALLRGLVEFPAPLDGFACVNINMMPVIPMLGESGLPVSVQRYAPLISACKIPHDEGSNVMYLSVHEEWVEPNATQRRPGLHVESPGLVQVSEVREDTGYWGNGYEVNQVPYGGIYFASNISESCAIYPMDWVEDGFPSAGGDIEGLRSCLTKMVLMRENELWWMSDRCPHEAIPVKGRTERYFRQFFRLVRGNISHWYSKHNTPNPDVPLPPNVKVIDINKFE